MKKLILIFMLLCGSVWAGTEEHEPSSDVSIQWVLFGGIATHWDKMGDESNATGVYAFDNDMNGFWEKYGWDNTAISDSIIDSVVFAVSCSVTNVANTISILDSLSGNAIRQSSAITFNAANEWIDSTITYTTSPAGAAWTWTGIDALIAGFIAVNIVDKGYIYIGEMWFTVYYHPEAGVTGQVIMITGD